MKPIKKETYTAGALRQYAVSPVAREERLGVGLSKIEVTARGGSMIASVGDGPQDLSLSSTEIHAGETKTIWVNGDDVRIAVQLLAESGDAVVQVIEYSKSTEEV